MLKEPPINLNFDRVLKKLRGFKNQIENLNLV